jgi:hypothetical protein
MMNGSRRQMNQDTSAHSHVKHKTQADQESQNSENEAAIASIMYYDTPLYQIQSNQVSIEHIVLSSVDINGIAISLNIPEDITDDASLTLTHNSEQDANNVDNFSDVSESQSIDINSINLNKHVNKPK